MNTCRAKGSASSARRPARASRKPLAIMRGYSAVEPTPECRLAHRSSGTRAPHRSARTLEHRYTSSFRAARVSCRFLQRRCGRFRQYPAHAVAACAGDSNGARDWLHYPRSGKSSPPRARVQRVTERKLDGVDLVARALDRCATGTSADATCRPVTRDVTAASAASSDDADDCGQVVDGRGHCVHARAGDKQRGRGPSRAAGMQPLPQPHSAAFACSSTASIKSSSAML